MLLKSCPTHQGALNEPSVAAESLSKSSANQSGPFGKPELGSNFLVSRRLWQEQLLYEEAMSSISKTYSLTALLWPMTLILVAIVLVDIAVLCVALW